MSIRATRAAEDLAAVLTAQAENLGSDELTVISEAMATVRSAARDLGAALTERGWGGGVLYGWGDPLDDDDDEGNEDEDEVEDEDEDDEPWVALTGQRMSYQARYDFILVDPAMFTEYVVRRATQAGVPEARVREQILEEGPRVRVDGADRLRGARLRGVGLGVGRRAGRRWAGTGHLVGDGRRRSRRPVPYSDLNRRLL